LGVGTPAHFSFKTRPFDHTKHNLIGIDILLLASPYV